MMVQKKACEQDIVVTGVSGRYPKSESVEELWENLIQGKVLYQKDEFPYPKSKLFNSILMWEKKSFTNL